MSEAPKDESEGAKETGSGPLFSRSGITGPDKCTEVLKTQVPWDTDYAFKKMAAAAGCSPSEMLRDLVCMAVHKKMFAELVNEGRRRRYALMGLPIPESGPIPDLLPPSE